MMFVKLLKELSPDKLKNKPNAIKTGMYTRNIIPSVTNILEDMVTILPNKGKSPK